MDDIIKKLEVLKNNFASCEHNHKFKHSDPEVEAWGIAMLQRRFSKEVHDIIEQLKIKNGTGNHSEV